VKSAESLPLPRRAAFGLLRESEFRLPRSGVATSRGHDGSASQLNNEPLKTERAARAPTARDQASRVIIRHAPKADQTTNQATITATATVVDSGSSPAFRCRPPTRPLHRRVRAVPRERGVPWRDQRTARCRFAR